MPIYEFRCRECGNGRESQSRDILPCPCGGVLKRVFHCNVTPMFQEHFNHSVGRYVSSKQDFNDGLKQASEDASQARVDPITGKVTQIEHNFQPVEAGDTKALGVTDEGLETTMRDHRDKGLYHETGVSKPSNSKVFH